MDGKYVEYYYNGQKRLEGTMILTAMNGKWTFWYHSGQKESEIICKNGELVDGTVWDDDGNVKESARFNYKR